MRLPLLLIAFIALFLPTAGAEDATVTLPLSRWDALVSQADASASLSGNAWGLLADDNGAYYFFAHLWRMVHRRRDPAWVPRDRLAVPERTRGRPLPA